MASIGWFVYAERKLIDLSLNPLRLRGSFSLL